MTFAAEEGRDIPWRDLLGRTGYDHLEAWGGLDQAIGWAVALGACFCLVCVLWVKASWDVRRRVLGCFGYPIHLL